jgi:hypothetical protein
MHARCGQGLLQWWTIGALDALNFGEFGNDVPIVAVQVNGNGLALCLHTLPLFAGRDAVAGNFIAWRSAAVLLAGRLAIASATKVSHSSLHSSPSRGPRLVAHLIGTPYRPPKAGLRTIIPSQKRRFKIFARKKSPFISILRRDPHSQFARSGGKEASCVTPMSAMKANQLSGTVHTCYPNEKIGNAQLQS